MLLATPQRTSTRVEFAFFKMDFRDTEWGRERSSFHPPMHLLVGTRMCPDWIYRPASNPLISGWEDAVTTRVGEFAF